jgi:hypothetical protein
MNITNLTDAPLRLPMGGPTLRPGVATHVDRWDVLQYNDTVVAWLSVNAIEATERVQAAAVTSDDQDTDLDEVRAVYVARFSTEPDRRWGVATLREKIAEAGE